MTRLNAESSKHITLKRRLYRHAVAERKLIMKKYVAIVLMLVMLVAVAAGCSNTNGPGETTTTTAPRQPGDTSAPSDTTGVEYDEYGREIVADEIPEMNLGDRTFTIHTRGNVEQYEWKADSHSGDHLSDAIYKRNIAVEERLGVRLNIIAEGTWADYASVTLPKVKASIMSGNGEYDLIAGFSTPIATLATTGMLTNLNNVEQIDFDKPWWSSDMIEQLEVDNVNYYAVGSLSLSMIYSMQCIFVNTPMLEEVESGYNIYQTVLDNKWTWEEMTRLAALAYRDNGNGVRDDEDRYGLAFADATNSVYAYFYSTGSKLVTHNSAGEPEMSINAEKNHEIVGKLIDMMYNSEFSRAPGGTEPDFTQGNILFLDRWLYWGQTLYKDNMDEYGIVPMPMYNESQGGYFTPVQSGMHMYCIPTDVKNLDEDGYITEALAAESYRSLMPVYFEIVLKVKYAKDEQTSKMLDIMYETVSFDFGQIFNGELGALTELRNVVVSKNNNYMSINKATSGIYAKKLSQIIEDIAQNANN